MNFQSSNIKWVSYFLYTQILAYVSSAFHIQQLVFILVSILFLSQKSVPHLAMKVNHCDSITYWNLSPRKQVLPLKNRSEEVLCEQWIDFCCNLIIAIRAIAKMAFHGSRVTSPNSFPSCYTSSFRWRNKRGQWKINTSNIGSLAIILLERTDGQSLADIFRLLQKSEQEL